MIESVTDHIILIECNLCRGRWMVWVTRSHPSSMLPDHNTNSTKVTYLSTIRQSTVSRQLVSPLRSSTMFHSAQSSPMLNTSMVKWTYLPKEVSDCDEKGCGDLRIPWEVRIWNLEVFNFLFKICGPEVIYNITKVLCLWCHMYIIIIVLYML